MPLWPFIFEEINEQRIKALDRNNVPESHRLEYKREIYPHDDRGSREFLKDISAFANSSGGHLIIGFDEGAAPGSRVIGVAGDLSKEIERLESLARTALEPRISGFKMKAVDAEGGLPVLLARIPKASVRRIG